MDHMNSRKKNTKYKNASPGTLIIIFLKGYRLPRHQGDSLPANSPPRNDLATNVLATKRSGESAWWRGNWIPSKGIPTLVHYNNMYDIV